MVARSRPRYTWRFWQSAQSIATATSVGIDLGTAGGMVSLSDLGIKGDYTLRRIRGQMAVSSSRNSESQVDVGIAWGIYIADTDAFAAAAWPEPSQDPADWLAFGTVYADQRAALGGAFHPTTFAPLESKAMRKVNENNQTVALIIQWLSLTDQVTQVNTSGRLLVSHGQR